MAIRIDGIDALKKRLGKDPIRDMSRALLVEGEAIMTVSKRRTPVNKKIGFGGTLRASGHVKPPHIRGPRAEVVLGYGGAASDYALIQHERLDYQHDVGQAKYLESSMNDAAPGFGRRVSKHLDLFE